MDAYDRCTNLEKKFAIVLPSTVKAGNFSDHPCTASISALPLKL
jgi:hypothetical protein